MGKLDEKSLAKLAQVDPKLRAVVLGAADLYPEFLVVAEGLRSKAQAIINYRKGRTAAELHAAGITEGPLPGPKVTWTLHSKHVEGKAVDIYPLVEGKLDDGRKGMQNFDELYHCMMASAAKLKTRIRYGGDWNQNGQLRERGETDSPHFELA